MGRRCREDGEKVEGGWGGGQFLLYLNHSHKSISQCCEDSAILSGSKVQDGVVQLHRPQLLPVKVRREREGKKEGGQGEGKVLSRQDLCVQKPVK